MIENNYSIIIGLISFIVSIIFTTYLINKKNPTIIRPLIINTGTGEETTINWRVIIRIITACSGLAAAMIVTSNLIIFLIWKVWEIDLLSTFVIIIVFLIFVFQEFDKSITKIIH